MTFSPDKEKYYEIILKKSHEYLIVPSWAFMMA